MPVCSNQNFQDTEYNNLEIFKYLPQFNQFKN